MTSALNLPRIEQYVEHRVLYDGASLTRDRQFIDKELGVHGQDGSTIAKDHTGAFNFVSDLAVDPR